MDLKIAKNELLVEIMFVDSGQSAEDFYLYLDQFSPIHKSEQTLEEFINSDHLFIPAKKYPDREFQILNIQKIIFIREKSAAKELPHSSIFVTLGNGQDYEIKLFEALPDFHSRAIDFFNTPRIFLPFIHGLTKIHINRNHILRAREK